MSSYFDAKIRKLEFINVDVVNGDTEQGVRADCDDQADVGQANIEMSGMRW